MAEREWATLLACDPTDWLLKSDEPAARWFTLTAILGYPESEPEAQTARQAVLQDPGCQRLMTRLPDWEQDNSVSGHNSPGYAPNLLLLLHEMGVREGDDARVDRLLDQMISHQDEAGHFQSYGKSGHGAIGRLAEAQWGALLCDSHVILDVLARYGRAGDQRVARGLVALVNDVTSTPQGLGWQCAPHTVSGFRGPGRKNDFCPQVTVEALRVLAHLRHELRPDGARRESQPDSPLYGLRSDRLSDAVKSCIGAWCSRGTEKPYMFGHGAQFKTVKWPTFWYDIYAVLDAVADFPEVWAAGECEGTHSSTHAGTQPATYTQAVAEMAACLVAYNFGAGGKVTPRSCYRGFEQFSFSQKKQPSAFATAKLVSVLQRLEPLVEQIRDVDVRALASSKGGTGHAVPPK